MRRLALVIVVAGALWTAMPTRTLADWDPNDPAKWVQLPDLSPTGMDVLATIPKVLADDWLCTSLDPITDIHIWGSWLNDQYNPLTTFKLSIHSDIPADPNTPYSRPGDELWVGMFGPGSYSARPFATAEELFYDPNIGQVIGRDTIVWQYNFLSGPDPFFFQEGTPTDPIIYWLDVQALVPGSELFGWKTSFQHNFDAAVFGDAPPGVPVDPWRPLVYPVGHPFEGQPIDMSFVLTTVPEPGSLALLMGMGAAGSLILMRRPRR